MLDFASLNEWLSASAPDSVVTERHLANLLGKHPVSIKRAVGRGELPRPVRMFGENCWTARALREHIAKRLEQARREAEQAERRISSLAS